MNDLFSLKGKNIVLTGGCGNLGHVMAEGLLQYGARLFVVDITDALPGALASFGDRVSYIKCDLSSTDSVKAMLAEVEKKGDGIDVLINNAAYGGGIGGRSAKSTRLEDFDDDTWAFGLDGTVGVTFRCIREAVPFFERNGSGAIVNIASMYGVVSPDHSIYGGSGYNSPVTYGAGKAGVIQLTRYSASYLAPKGIRVNCITPGPFPNITPALDTDLLAKLQSKTMLGRTGNAEELVGPLLLLCSEASSFMTGANIIVDGGWTAW